MEVGKVYIFTDGACSGNPGPGGWCTILKYLSSPTDIIRKKIISGSRSNATNNEMELTGVIEGLKAIKKHDTPIEVVSDSKYICDAFNKKWIDNWVKNGWRTASKTPVKNVKLWKKLLELKALFSKDVTFTWIKGHNGMPENEECDLIARKEINQLLANIQ